jgi:hypothetical protein
VVVVSGTEVEVVVVELVEVVVVVLVVVVVVLLVVVVVVANGGKSQNGDTVVVVVIAGSVVSGTEVALAASGTAPMAEAARSAQVHRLRRGQGSTGQRVAGL